MSEKGEGSHASRRASPLGRRRYFRFAMVGVAIFAAFAGSGITYFAMRCKSREPAHLAEPRGSAQSVESGDSGAITLAKAKWEVAGIRIEPAHRETLSQVVQVTGKLALNEDRLAQIYSQVEGMVHEVPVHFGQQVTAGQTLVVIDSQQIGLAKLELIKSRLATRLAEVDYQWQQTVETNVQALIEALRKRVPLAQIEETFLDRDMGDYRSQLVSAYARLHKSQADYERLKDLSEQRITAGKDLLTVQAALEADQVTMLALLEQIKFTSSHSRLAAEHELEKAKTAESVSELNLRILGVSDTTGLAETLGSGAETVSHYTITAPFVGSIIQKDVVLEERVDPTAMLFTVADLSTVWVKVDIFDQYIPLLAQLMDKSIHFRVNAYPDQVFEGHVFSTGSAVDDTTRTLPMTAIAENPQRLLKPGMFVEVELRGEPLTDVLAVPVSAIQEHENKRFVFVHLEGDEFVRRDVSTGRAGGDMIEVTAGLADDEAVVVDGGFFLKSQMLAEQFADED